VASALLAALDWRVGNRTVVRWSAFPPAIRAVGIAGRIPIEQVQAEYAKLPKAGALELGNKNLAHLSVGV